jgi:hypothetical protein
LKHNLFFSENQGYSCVRQCITKIKLFSLIFWQEQAEKLAGTAGAIAKGGSDRWM